MSRYLNRLLYFPQGIHFLISILKLDPFAPTGAVHAIPRSKIQESRSQQ